MKIALIGASGFIGSALLHEALLRGHQVSALVLHPQKLGARAGLTALQSDVMNTVALTEQLHGHDVVISAFSGHAVDDTLQYYLQGFTSIVAAVKAAAVPRLLLVGGAGSLYVAPGVQLLDAPGFPEQWKATAEGARQALLHLQRESTLDWSMLSPSAHIEPGQRDGRFRLGGDELLVDAAGNSHISLQNYALAMFDEVEHPAHSRCRFTVGV